MTESYQELVAAIEELKRQFAVWRDADVVSLPQHARIEQLYNHWTAELNPSLDYSSVLPSPRAVSDSQKPLEVERRRLRFIEQEIRRQGTQQRLTPAQTESMVAEIAGRREKLERQFNGDGLSEVQPTPAQTDTNDAPKGRSLVEYVLDPRSLQALMATGGALLMLGLVIWLWSIGVFANPIVVAVCLGGANLGLLAVGASMVRYSRYQTAGRAITLLACLVLPLNLWFYDAQGLITIKHGGHLWVPALVCCAIYAGVARLLKDSMFVYTLVAGVTMTGLLFLADQSINRFWEILGPSAFMVVLGAACVHVERLFQSGDGPFSREKFGRAFFYSGHLVMGAGLIVLLAGRLVGDFYDPVFADWVSFTAPHVVTETSAKLIALLLTLLATYTYAYSQITIAPTKRRYAYLSVFSLLWSEVILLHLLNVPTTEGLWLLVLASTGLVAAVASLLWRKGGEAVEQLSRVFGSVGAACTGVAVAWGALALARGLFVPAESIVAFPLDMLYLVGMVIATAGCVIGGRMAQQRRHEHTAEWLQYAAGLPLVGAVAALIVTLGVTSLSVLLPLAVIAPVGLAVASRFSRDKELANSLRRPGTAGTLLLLGLSIGVISGFAAAPLVASTSEHLALAAFYAAAAGLLGLGAVREGRNLPLAVAGISACASVWQLLSAAGLAEYAPLVAASTVGLATMAVARRKDRTDGDPVDRLATVGAVIVLFGSLGGLLMTLSRLVSGEQELALIALAAGQGLAVLLSSIVSTSRDWKTTSRTLAGMHVLAGVLVANVMAPLTMWERTEIITVVAGLLLLAAGHVRWRREGERRDPAVDLQLLAGSVLSAGPLVFGLLAQRFTDYSPVWGIAMLHELGALLVGLVLLGAGVLCRVKVTTFTGSVSLTAWIVSLVALVHLPELQSAAVYMMIGGGAFFAAAVLLSIYRDRLLALPQKVRAHEGVFRVLDWR
ncbi:hypothetical protein [Aeoliella sp.]|uniref:hypothetical protein n=1 Tax=Aeoliella sp. TaxID=2795800 RepID=UPI003CCBF859